MKVTTMIPNPSWGKTLELLQEKKTIRISSIDSETFEKMQRLENYYFSGSGSNPLNRLFIDDFTEELHKKGISLNTNTKYYLEDLKNQL
jgi:hypothetical protein